MGARSLLESPLSTILPNLFLSQDHLTRLFATHLAQPCYVGLGRSLDLGLIPLAGLNKGIGSYKVHVKIIFIT